MIRISEPTILTSNPALLFRTKRVQWHSKGFTLIEVLIVIALIALVVTVGIPNLTLALKANINNSSRQLASTIRNAYDEAVLKGQVYRLVFDLDRNQYWVEAGDKNFLMRSAEQEEAELRKYERFRDEEKEKRKDPFALARNITKDKVKLPYGVTITELVTSRSKEAQKSGIAYAHIFPHGFVEKLTIHLKDDLEREATLMVNPVTGKSRLYQRYVREEE